MKRLLTIWENDLTEDIDPKTLAFILQCLPYHEVKHLSALYHRDKIEILESVKESHTIIIQPNLFDTEQVKDIAKFISHPIHISKNSNKDDYEIINFYFLSNDPWETLNEVLDMLQGVKDNVNELALMKILKNCHIHFFNFDESIHYELERNGYFNTQAIRYK